MKKNAKLSIYIILTALVLLGMGSCNDTSNNTENIIDEDYFTKGTIYYMSMTGSDRNSGKSEASPWRTIDKINSADLKPGDQVRFKRGNIFYGTLVPKSGEEGNPIIYGAYGQDSGKPIIDGFGSYAAVSSSGSSGNFIIRDLEIVNDDVVPAKRCGVFIEGNGPSVSNVRLINLTIHDIKNLPILYAEGWWENGAIFIKGQTHGDRTGNIVNMLIKDCYLYDITGETIYANNTPAHIYQVGTIPFEKRNTGLRIENTIIRNTGGQGISLPDGMYDYVIDGCGVYDIGYANNLIWYFGAVYSGSNGVIQNCEIARIRPGGDSHAFDNDQSSFIMTIIQHNYVRDCAGAFLMNWPGDPQPCAATIARYNVSINNGSHFPVIMLGTSMNHFFYNNVFYNDKEKPFKIAGYRGDAIAFVNNVFYTNSPEGVLDFGIWAETMPVPYFDHNAFYNTKGAPIIARTFENGGAFVNTNEITSDPGYTGIPGGKGINENMSSNGYETIITGGPLRDIRELASFFKITSDSPLFEVGRIVTKDEVIDFLFGLTDAGHPSSSFTKPAQWVINYANIDLFDMQSDLDFFGNTVTGIPSIGIHQGGK